LDEHLYGIALTAGTDYGEPVAAPGQFQGQFVRGAGGGDFPAIYKPGDGFDRVPA
jgi:hypothetical protein